MLQKYIAEQLAASVGFDARSIAAENVGDNRHRYLSLAVTHMEEAENWLNRLVKDLDYLEGEE